MITIVKIHKASIMTALIAGSLLVGCQKFENAKVQTTVLNDEIPDYGYKSSTPSYNATIHLGRVLFYDKSLSLNNSVSCASCHKQEYAFADNVAQSRGIENKLTSRNSIAIQNLMPNVFGFETSTSLFWDGREQNINALIGKPIANHIEMGMDNTDKLIQKLNALPYYKNIAQTAYGKNELTMNDVSSAMVTFISLITTANSRFDQSRMNSANNNTFTALEQRGEFLFNNTYNCSRCHNPNPGPYMNGNDFANIGLDVNAYDAGRKGVTGNSADAGKFKIPDLHNVAITAPYMHDGRFNTLEDVLEHYSENIKANKNLDSRLQNADGSPISLQIKPEDKKAIIAFLQTLTDYKTITNPLLSNPFTTK